jgi:hypothetical protein
LGTLVSRRLVTMPRRIRSSITLGTSEQRHFF